MASPATKQLNRELKKAKKVAAQNIFNRPEIVRLQEEVRKADLEVNKAQRKVKQAQRQLKRTPKPSKTLLQRVFAGGRGGGGGGGAGGFEFNKATGKLQRRVLLK